MFGMDELRQQEADAISPAITLQQVISRSRSVPLMRSVQSAIGDDEERDFSALKTAAVCLDTNLLFKALASNKRDDIIDYFRARHAGPLIVSAQTIQEFWNNYHNVLDTITKGVENKLVDLERSLNSLDGAFADYKVRISAILEDFKHDNEHLFARDLKRHVLAFMALLDEKGIEAEAPRHMFYDEAVRRKAAKTPPGFKDSGDGDFWVWLDFLYGLLLVNSRENGSIEFTKAILITADRKSDWVKGNVAHPVLVAEAKEIAQVPFEIWSLSDLLRGIRES